LEQYGIESAQSYPVVKGTCDYDASDVVYKISGYTDIAPSDNDALLAAVAGQPVATAVAAD